MRKRKIETYWDPRGFKGGKKGCWRARIKGRHGCHSAGTTEDETVNDLLLTAKSFEMSGDRNDYEVIARPDWSFKEGQVFDDDVLVSLK